MAIKSVYNKYFQKSKVFLYPLLGIKRGASVIPSETYIALGDTIKPEDMKLVCLYHPRKDDEYKHYENKVLLKHSRLYDIKVLNDEDTLFIFDFSDLKDDWNNFIKGKYSHFKNEQKGTIKSFFDRNSANYTYMSSFLHHDKHFHDYAECLNIKVEVLETVGELCSIPDLDKETLTIKDLELENIK